MPIAYKNRIGGKTTARPMSPIAISNSPVIKPIQGKVSSIHHLIMVSILKSHYHTRDIIQV